ncbi:OLC1v1030372C1 [Oldenlandia corymbosa var. corymbosa]|uniref:OLC1v1030372C1 n=1 Tax=Oldenlandia corymbosa var. corymbosa TaxID=529605 RepID=A0AAV1CFW9_OLDCO|nr:OLC1v1030372C1 [Oldenlandia corymbosa var. corymbosa]
MVGRRRKGRVKITTNDKESRLEGENFVGSDGVKEKKELGKSIRVQQDEELERLAMEIETASSRASSKRSVNKEMFTPEEGMGCLSKGNVAHLSDGCFSGKILDAQEVRGKEKHTKRQLNWDENRRAVDGAAVWDGSGAEKLKALIGKLKLTPPCQRDGQVVAKIRVEDVQAEEEFWENAVACFVLGVSPPKWVMEDFFKRAWGRLGIEQVIQLPYDIFVVRFKTAGARDEVLNINIRNFGNKPLIVKPWSVGMGLNFRDVDKRVVKGKEVREEDAEKGLEIAQGSSQPGKEMVKELRSKEGNKMGDGTLRDKGAISSVADNQVVTVRCSSFENLNKVTSEPDTGNNTDISCGKDKGILIDPGPVSNEIGTEKVNSRIDRVLVNGEWVDLYSDSIVSVLEENISDHSPLVLQFEGEMQRKPSPFQYFNMWSLSPQFKDIVKKIWETEVEGIKMFQVCFKLRLLKGPLRMLNKEQFGDVVEEAQRKQLILEAKQELLSRDASNVKLGVEGMKWKSQKNGKYSVTSGYKWLIGGGEKDINARCIWATANVPKHAFIGEVTEKDSSDDVPPHRLLFRDGSQGGTNASGSSKAGTSQGTSGQGVTNTHSSSRGHTSGAEDQSRDTWTGQGGTNTSSSSRGHTLGSEPNGRDVMQTDFFKFRHKNKIPQILHNHVQSYLDVTPDGNCGFRVFASCMLGGQNNHVLYRQIVYDEVINNPRLYENLYGYEASLIL